MDISFGDLHRITGTSSWHNRSDESAGVTLKVPDVLWLEGLKRNRLFVTDWFGVKVRPSQGQNDEATMVGFISQLVRMENWRW